MRRRGIAELVRRAILSDAATLSRRFVHPHESNRATGRREWRVGAFHPIPQPYSKSMPQIRVHGGPVRQVEYHLT